MTKPTQNVSPYYAPHGGHPPQTDLLTDRAVVTQAYTVIPRGVMKDIVTSRFPEWTETRAWVLNRPIAGGATTFSQVIVEVAPGGGAKKPEPQPEVASFIFNMEGELSLTIDGKDHTLTPGGYAFIPAGAAWSAANTGAENARFHWFRKRAEPIAEHPAYTVVGNERDITPGSMPGTDGRWRTTRMLDPNDFAFDFGVNIVTFEPGASIPFAETHIMEHGLYVLQGKGVYRLNADWVEVQEGDYMSLRAFCPQACYAGGPEPFRYLLYKDQNRQIML